MTTTVIMDRAGRVVLPKALREEMQLAPGDSLKLETDGDQITLRPKREQSRLIKKEGFWVRQGTGEMMSASSTDQLLDKIRLEREDSFFPSAK